MKKFWIQIALMCLIVVVALYVTFSPDSLNPYLTTSPSLSGSNTVETPNKRTQLKVGSVTIPIEVADTAAKRTKGLSDRVGLDAESGMLFVFPKEDKYRLWMKGMKFNLDFIFIRDGKVVDIIKNVPAPAAGVDEAQLPVYEPIEPVDMLLEVNAGFADRHRIKVTDSVFLVK